MSLVSEIEADIQTGQRDDNENSKDNTEEPTSPPSKHNLDIKDPIIPIEIPPPKKGVKRGRPPLNPSGKRFRSNSKSKPLKP